MGEMEKYCRTCFRHNEFKKFAMDSVSQISGMQIGEMVMYCLQVQISPYDRLPQQICGTCLTVLNSIFFFRKQYYQADSELRKLLENMPAAKLEGTDPNLELELDLLLDAAMVGQTSETLDQILDEPMNHIPDHNSDEQSLPLETEAINCESDYIVGQRTPNLAPGMTRLFECVQCSRRLSCKGNLVRHQKCWNHTGIRAITVEKAPDKKFVGSLKKFRSKMYECEQCFHRASFKGNLVRHQTRLGHTGIRVIEPSDEGLQKTIKKLLCCGECDYQTILPGAFRHHQRARKHTTCNMRDIQVDEVMEKCPECPHCGAQRSNLQEHMEKWCTVLLYGTKGKAPITVRKYPARRSKTGPKVTDPVENKPETNEPDASSNSESPAVVEKSPKPPILVTRYYSKMFECKQCHHRTSLKGNLMRHLRNLKHTGIREITPNEQEARKKQMKTLQQCDDCGFQTFIGRQFVKHQRLSRHKQCSSRQVEVDQVLEKFPKCPHCGLLRGNLQLHMARSCPKLRYLRRLERCGSKSDNTSQCSMGQDEDSGSTVVPSSTQDDICVKLEFEENLDTN